MFNNIILQGKDQRDFVYLAVKIWLCVLSPEISEFVNRQERGSDPSGPACDSLPLCSTLLEMSLPTLGISQLLEATCEHWK